MKAITDRRLKTAHTQAINTALWLSKWSTLKRTKYDRLLTKQYNSSDILAVSKWVTQTLKLSLVNIKCLYLTFENIGTIQEYKLKTSITLNSHSAVLCLKGYWVVVSKYTHMFTTLWKATQNTVKFSTTNFAWQVPDVCKPQVRLHWHICLLYTSSL